MYVHTLHSSREAMSCFRFNEKLLLAVGCYNRDRLFVLNGDFPRVEISMDEFFGFFIYVEKQTKNQLPLYSFIKEEYYKTYCFTQHRKIVEFFCECCSRFNAGKRNNGAYFSYESIEVMRYLYKLDRNIFSVENLSIITNMSIKKTTEKLVGIIAF